MVASTRSDSPLVALLYDPLLREEECRAASALQDGGRCDAQCELYLTECVRLEALATGLPCSAWAAFQWDGSDCTLQALLLGDRCPAVPEHMRNLSRSVALEKEGWQDRPSTCLTSAELWFAENGSWVITSGLALIFFAMINARRISKMASEWAPRLALSHRYGRKLRRALLRPLHSRDAGGRLSTPGIEIDTAATGPCTAAAATAAAPTVAVDDGVLSHESSLTLAAWADRLEPGAANAPALLADCLALTRQPPTPQGYLGIEARRKRDARVRALLLPIAEQLAACFGLQRAQRDGSNPDPNPAPNPTLHVTSP